MDEQQIFEYVINHLLKQGKPALLGPCDELGHGCAYRGNEGTMCAVGCLIPDEHYTPQLEGKMVMAVDVRKALRLAGIYRGNDEDSVTELLASLQSVHDNGAGVQDWAEYIIRNARDVAEVHDLDTTFLPKQ